MNVNSTRLQHRPVRMPRSRASLALAALTLAGGFTLFGALADSAQAQVFVRPFYYGGTWSGPIPPPLPEGPRRLPLDALYEEIGDQGYRPLGVVGRARDTLTIDAIGPGQRRVRLTVDAFDGEILARRPLVNARAEPQHPHIRPVPAPPRQGAVRIAPEREASPPAPPRRKTVEATPKAAPAPANPQGLNPITPNDSPPKTTPPQNAAPKTGPVAPARDPSQWGKEG